MSGEVFLYDIDFNAAQDNEIIGNMFNQCEGAKSIWSYHAVKTAQEAMQSADFVIISKSLISPHAQPLEPPPI